MILNIQHRLCAIIINTKINEKFKEEFLYFLYELYISFWYYMFNKILKDTT